MGLQEIQERQGTLAGAGFFKDTLVSRNKRDSSVKAYARRQLAVRLFQREITPASTR
jgi:hypothetical protein